MKKIFAIFCAVVLMPHFSAQAWIGGPFSNNNHFGATGDDGVYEAVGTTTNGIGLYRLVVGNAFPGVNPAGVQSSVPSQQPNTGNVNPLIVPGISSGNIFFGGLGNSNNMIWYFEGVAYLGVNTIGTVNSVQGIAVAVGSATTNGVTLSSGWEAVLASSGNFLPARAFSGTGEFRLSSDPNTAISFTVFGNKVSSEILFGL
ncbi:MAG: hypothetical protein AAGF67_04510 [Verrucomicrobiota bacterium]